MIQNMFGLIETTVGKRIGRMVKNVPVRAAPDGSRVVYDLRDQPLSILERSVDWRSWPIVATAQVVVQVLTLRGFKIDHVGAITNVEDIPPK
ncbi:MAG: hypothetical protein UR81_C0036G0003 [Candidatus Levybacteria bacterium GW2011_GWB1_35_5]|nr:MAG: hypothetical protein UR81_C0036G0003 [Candidatus Levybacteria bacterium GW2011_GWB1_35_5]